MKKQIVRLSPHQNGKVFGILTAIAMLLVSIPIFFVFTFFSPPVGQHGHQGSFPAFLLLLFPLLYLIFGYISVVIGCAIYNFLFRYIGGFEFESWGKKADNQPLHPSLRSGATSPSSLE